MVRQSLDGTEVYTPRTSNSYSSKVDVINPNAPLNASMSTTLLSVGRAELGAGTVGDVADNIAPEAVFAGGKIGCVQIIERVPQVLVRTAAASGAEDYYEFGNWTTRAAVGLSQARWAMSVVSIQRWIVFAGGQCVRSESTCHSHRHSLGMAYKSLIPSTFMTQRRTRGTSSPASEELPHR